MKGNDLSKLKSIKLLFFISAIKDKEDLLDIFDNYSALPYGHVEMDIYNAITDDKLKFFKINNSNTSLKGRSSLGAENFNNIDKDLKDRIINSINTLLKKNPDIIFFKAFDLVEISHEWFSWKFYFNRARLSNTFKSSIPIETIRAEPKIFNLT